MKPAVLTFFSTIFVSVLLAQPFEPFDETSVSYVLGKETIWDVDFSPDGSTVVASSANKRLIFWNPVDGSVVKSVDVGESALFSVDYSPDGEKVVAGCWKNGMYTVDATSGVLIDNFGGDIGVNKLSYHPSKDWVLVAGSDNNPRLDFLRIYDVETGEVVKALYEGRGSIEFPAGICWSPDGTKAACGMANKNQIIRVYDVETGENIVSKKIDFEASAMHWSPDGKYLCTGGTDKKVKLWNAETLELIWSAEWHKGSCGAVEFSPDGNYIAAAGRGHGHHLRIYSASNGEILQTIGEKNSVMNNVSWSPNGQGIALAATVYGDIAEVAITRVYKTSKFGRASENTEKEESETGEKEPVEPSTGWYEYTSAKAKFSALFPVEPKPIEVTQDKHGRDKYKIEASTKSAYTLILVTTLGRKTSTKKSLDVAQAIAGNFLKRMEVDPEEKTKILSPDGTPGTGLVFYKKGLRYRYVAYAKGKHTYQAIYMTKNKSSTPEENKFIDHFSLK